MAKKRSSASSRAGDILIQRDLKAQRSIVFEAWIDPKRLSQWWVPRGFTITRCDLDVRQGGAIRIDMLGPDRTPYYMCGFYEEIVALEKLVFSSSPVDFLGHSLLDVLDTVTFEGKGGKTTLTLQTHVLRSIEESAPYLEGMESGWKESLDRLEAYLATNRP